MTVVVRTRRDAARTGARLAICLLALAPMGCYVGPGGTFESHSESADEAGEAQEADDEVGPDPTDPDTTGGFPSGPACDFELGANPIGETPCTVAADCCAGPVVPVSLAGAAGCPSNEFPNNWSCQRGACVQGGCSDNGQCKSMMGNQWICAQISGVGHCVVACSDDGDCDAENMPQATCQSVGSLSICMQT